jgi:hypothetical protein
MLKRVNRRVNLLGLIFILVVIQIFSFNTLKSIFARDYHIKDVQILVSINTDGSFNWTENRTFVLNGDFSWGTYELSKKGFNRLENFSIQDEVGLYLRNESGDDRTFEIIEDSEKYVVKYFYRVHDAEKTFTIKYKIIGGIKDFGYTTEFYWKFIGSGWVVPTNHLKATVILPKEVKLYEINVSAHGPPQGRFEKLNGKEIVFEVDSIPSKTFVEGQINFPSRILNLKSESASQSTPIPKEWNSSKEYQKIPITLESVTYYAYEIERKEENKLIKGWFIIDKDNRIVLSRDYYEKLALTATVTKYAKKLNELKKIKDEVELLDKIKWKLIYDETPYSIIKTISDDIDTLILEKIPKDLSEEYLDSSISVPKSIIMELNDKFLNEFTEFVSNDMTEIYIDTGELTSDTSDVSALKVFGVIKVVIRKEVFNSFKKGFNELKEAYNIIESHKDPWSYEDASLFLEKYEDGEARAIAYGSWFLRSLSSSVWKGSWNNAFKQVLPELISEPADFNIKFNKWFSDDVKTENADPFSYNKVINDIESISSHFMLYKQFYDTSLDYSITKKVYSEIILNSLR